MLHAVRHLLEGHGDAHELEVAVAVPDEQLTALRHVLTRLVVDLPAALHRDQVLLLWGAGRGALGTGYNGNQQRVLLLN